jgi:hypothetical protein
MNQSLQTAFSPGWNNYFVLPFSVMASHQRKIYQNDTGQSWWLCRHENADAFILFEEKLSERRTELQISDFFDSEHSTPAQQALLKLIDSLAVLRD